MTSIFKKRGLKALGAPDPSKPLMRVLEPRILLDAAAVETALDIAGQAAHSQFADDFLTQTLPIDEPTDNRIPGSEAGGEVDRDVDFDSIPKMSDALEIVFVDAGIANREELIASLDPNANIVMIETGSDGVAQIEAALYADETYSAIHIFAHGNSGFLALGDSALSATSITGQHNETLARIGERLSDDADILIYGCNFGQGEFGEQAARLLAVATGADIAASDDLTGSEALAGDWDLELRVGEVSAAAYSVPQWHGILGPSFSLEATTEPVLAHISGGSIGTTGTSATWSDSVVLDPGGGGPLQFFDIRATIISTSGSATATFETVSTTDPTLDDFRVVVTNVGPVVETVDGTDVLLSGSVTVIWEVYDRGTDDLATQGDINIILSDLDGLVGASQPIEGVGIFLPNLASYTVSGSSNLDLGVNEAVLQANGTIEGVDDPNSQLGASWNSVNQFLITYSSSVQTTEFVMDGDGDAIIASPVVTATQSIDLDSDDSTTGGNDYTVMYLNGQPAGPVADVPVQIVDGDVSIFDINDTSIERVTVQLTNASAGDQLNFNPGILSQLGINANLDNSVPGQITLTLEAVAGINDSALITNFETALKTVTYQNVNSDGAFDTITPRVITFELDDGIVSTSGSETTITFGTIANPQDPNAVPNVYVANEDELIVSTTGNGLLGNDINAGALEGARDSLGNVIPFDSTPTLLPSGATIILNVDGSFIYAPAAYASGTEYIEYTISNNGTQSTSWATFDIQPVVNAVTLTIDQPDPVTDEDQPSNPLSVIAGSDDPSESQVLLIQNVPEGVIVTDGVFTFQTSGLSNQVEVSLWDTTQIRVLPIANSDEDITLQFTAVSMEIDGSTDTEQYFVTFEVNAVADPVILTTSQLGGAIDADVDLGSAINVALFDTDGSEQITDITLANIPTDNGAQVLLNGVPADISSGSLSLQPSDLQDLIFHPPQVAANATYAIQVFVTSTEVNPENGVTIVSHVEGPIDIDIDLNNVDDPVWANPDEAITGAGLSVTIDVLDNDFVPDGGGHVTHVEGFPVDQVTVVPLVGGEGSVTLNSSGDLIFTAASNFTGEVTFDYTIEDIDNSTDTSSVSVNVLPAWGITGDATVDEPGTATYQIGISGSVPQGDSLSIDLQLNALTASTLDYGILADAMTDSIAANVDAGFSFDGNTLSYQSPILPYQVDYDPTGSSFEDISGTGSPLNLGDNGLANVLLGYEFQLFGDHESSVYVSANGYVTFGSPVDLSTNASLDGTAFGGRNAIAAYWDDLDTSAGQVYSQTITNADGTHRTIIQWQNVEHSGGAGPTVSFQIVLNEADDSVSINYADTTLGGGLTNGGSATIGVEGVDGQFTEHSFNGSGALESGASLTFTRPPAEIPTLVLSLPIVDDSLFELEETFELRLASPSGGFLGTSRIVTEIAPNDNSSPVAFDDFISVTETGNTSLNVITDTSGGMGPDSDGDGQGLILTEINGVAFADGDMITLPSGTQIQAFSDGTVNYHSNGVFNNLDVGETALDSFQYTVFDGLSGTGNATVNVTITGENIIATIDVEDDGTNPAVNLQTVYQPSDPVTAITSVDSFIIDGDDTTFLSLTVTLDGFLQSDHEIVTLFGEALAYGQLLSTTLDVNGTTLDLDYDGADSIVVTNPLGEIDQADAEAILRDVTYQNISGFDVGGLRTLTFHVTDGSHPSAAAVAEVVVVGVNAPPVAANDGDVSAFLTPEDVPLTLTSATLLANDTDPDNNPLTIQSVQSGLHGSVTLLGNGDVVFTPDENYFGLTSFTYTVTDGLLGTDTATVFVEVTPVLDAPEIDLNGADAGIDHAAHYIEDGVSVSLVDSDMEITSVDGTTVDAATITINNARAGDAIFFAPLPGGIQADVVPNDAVTGIPADGTITIFLFNTSDIANYEAALKLIEFRTVSDTPSEVDRTVTIVTRSDGLNSQTATTVLSVEAANDDPIAINDGPIYILEDQTTNFTASSLIGNDTDPESDTLVLHSVFNAVNGTVQLLPNGDVQFTPDADYDGAASFEYTVRDDNGGFGTATMQLIVTNVNDAPLLDLDTNVAGQNFATAYVENGPVLQIVDASVTLSDVDDSHLESATITLTNGYVGDLLIASDVPSAITTFVTPSTELTSDGPITVTMIGTATLAEYETALQSIYYISTSERPDTTARVLDVLVNDGETNSLVATSTISVTEVNDFPVAGTETFVIAEDTTLTLLESMLISNDVDLDDTTLTITALTNMVGGTAASNGAGGITFTPDTDFFGAASFDYEVSDGRGGSTIATVAITVDPVNDIPTVDLNGAGAGTAVSLAYTENDTPLTLISNDVSLADVDDTLLEGAEFTLTNGRIGDVLDAPASVGPVTITLTSTGGLTADGAIRVVLSGPATPEQYEAALQAVTYHSVSEFPSEDQRSIEVWVSDGTALSTIAMVTIDVTAVNDIPIATADGPINVLEDTDLVLEAVDLIANDLDLDLDVLTINTVSNPSGGTVVINGSGQVVFTPTADYFGPASFDYQISDGNGGTASATVSVNVVAVNDIPVLDLNGATAGTNYAVDYTENQAGISVFGPDMLLDDVDDTLIEGGTVTLTNGFAGDFVEAPALIGPVAISIVPATALTSNGPITITLSGSGTHAEYVAALQAITYRSTSETPAITPRIVSAVLNDGDDNSSLVSTTISVTSVNDVPVAQNDGVLNVLEDTATTILAADLVANDTDLDGDSLVVTSVSNITNGIAGLDADGNILFTPNSDYFGPASFEYEISDGNGGTASAVVSINVVAVNDLAVLDLNGAAVGVDFDLNYTENQSGVSLFGADVVLSDVDDTTITGGSVTLADGFAGDILEAPATVGPVSIAIVPASALATAGQITITLSGTATHAEYISALQSITYRSTSESPAETPRTITTILSDGEDDTVAVSTIVNVTSVNDIPVAANDGVISIQEDIATTFLASDLIANDIDLDGDSLVITSVTNATNGTVGLDADGNVLFTPNLNYFGLASFDYDISDGNGGTSSATVSIDVVPVNDAPIAQNDGPVNLDEDNQISFDPITLNDTDIENDLLTVSAIDGSPIAIGVIVPVSNGTIELGSDGRTLIFVPDADFNGTVDVNYTISDGDATDDAQITFEVASVNDAPTADSAADDVTLLDSAIVNLPVGQHFSDADGDALLFNAFGLPSGLSINASTGIISGVLDSSASQGAPYAVTVQASDGMSTAASVSFMINVDNVAPTAVAPVTLALNEGDSFDFDATTLFSDADGDVLSYSVSGLPAWATFNAVSGEMSGIVPVDAALFGSVAVTFMVNDGDGGTVSTDVVLTPNNVAPVTTSTLTTLIAQEEDEMLFDVAAHFVDGGADNDALIFSVTGLPDGVTFDPLTGLITGTYAQGSAQPQEYNVILTADDGQGGMATDVLSIRIGDFDIVIDDDPEPETDPTDDQPPSTLDDPEDTNDDDPSDDLSGTPELDVDNGILISTVGGIDNLGATRGGGGVAAGIPSFNDLAGITNSSNWQVEGVHSYGTLTDPIEALELGKGGVLANMLEQVRVEAFNRGGALFIEIKENLSAASTLGKDDVTVTLKDGKPLPEWMKVIRAGFISANPPVNEVDVVLELKVKLPTGETVLKRVLVDLKSGDVKQTAGAFVGGDDASQAAMDAALEKLRGTLGTRIN